MPKSKSNLRSFSLKLSKEQRKEISLLTLSSPDLCHQYELFDQAIKWAQSNVDKLVAIANPKEGQNRTYYTSSSQEQINELSQEWNCNDTRAVFTAVVSFLKSKEEEIRTIHLESLSVS